MVLSIRKLLNDLYQDWLKTQMKTDWDQWIKEILNEIKRTHSQTERKE